MVSTVAGPAAGSFDDLADLIGRWKSGDDGAAQGIRFLFGHLPINFLYTRAALDYLFLYRVSESLNPGFLRRMEQRIERENGQTFLVRPSQVIN
ncbi:MAG: hypothetical protein IT345_07400 [Trueperaceae bacterium]|nr:hypothetical protein [Trueperaceae bacterium]